MKKVLFSEYEDHAYTMVALSKKECSLRIRKKKYEKLYSYIAKAITIVSVRYKNKDSFIKYMALHALMYAQTLINSKFTVIQNDLAQIRNIISKTAEEDGYEITKF